ncbi:polysaccharide deacetylase family protein [Dictyobacter arantiisoli]|uniref:NodB homology domain-containing protein n=1 Tax=Dictyobacter arantiisoli TaxID=2014874 RepID=A0A5A5TAM1_9CHLR|nr:polysaccharide deacetylase family protein [Dictyobacter arantiisoli]GCF08206.1 hypothetical protein KDI_17700 [Dictyobacter arantiisoli]
MRRRLLIYLAGCFYYSGLVALARWWTRHAGKRVIIVNYHTATGGAFLQHLLYLRKHYRIMPVEAALAELYSGSVMLSMCQGKKDRRTPLVVTLDDGYTDNFSYGMQLAHDYCVPLSIYLIPGYINSGQRFWWFEGKYMARHTAVPEVLLEKQTFQLQHEDGRVAMAQFIDERTRHATSVAERETFLTTARELLKLSSSSTQSEQDREHLPINWDQARAMEQSGWISFGAHTMHHPILSYLSDASEIKREVTECRQVLEQKLGHPIRSFAYPVGQEQHIGTAVVQAVQEAGYDWALTTTYGFNTPATDPYRLKRIEADVDQHWLIVAVASAGLWGFIAHMRWFPFIRKNFTNASYKKGL